MKETKGQQLKKLYEAAKEKRLTLTQFEFADAIGYSRSQLIRFFNGEDFDDNILIKAQNLINGTSNIPHETNGKTFHQKLSDKKNVDNEDGLIYVPVSAQAGYSKRVKDPSFEKDFERVYLPGLKYKGAKYRIFEVNGDSMETTLKEGMQVIAELVEPEGWKTIANHYIYVIVSDDMITIKRIFRKNEKQWVLISDNEDYYDQILFEIKNLKELWKVKRKLEWDMPPPKKFEIKV